MLIDTSGLLCLQHRSETFHEKACSAYAGATQRLTHNYVFAEFVALAAIRRLPRSAVLEFMVDLLESPEVETVWVSEGLHREALALLLARGDKTYSLCDAVSFILMRRNGTGDALTTDRHFEQEGFRRLLA